MPAMWAAVLILLACVMTVMAVWHKLLFAEGFCLLYNLLFVVFYHASKTGDALPLSERHKEKETLLQNVRKRLSLSSRFKWKCLYNGLLILLFYLKLIAGTELTFLNVKHKQDASAFRDCPFSAICTALQRKKGYVWAEMYVKFCEMGWNVSTDCFWPPPVYARLPTFLYVSY